MTTTTPSTTWGTAAALRSGSLAANTDSSAIAVDLSSIVEGRVTVKVTPNATVNATHGLRVDVFNVYSASATVSVTPKPSFTIAPLTGSTVKDFYFDLKGGWKYSLLLHNNDPSNQLDDVSVTLDTSVIVTA